MHGGGRKRGKERVRTNGGREQRRKSEGDGEGRKRKEKKREERKDGVGEETQQKDCKQ